MYSSTLQLLRFVDLFPLDLNLHLEYESLPLSHELSKYIDFKLYSKLCLKQLSSSYQALSRQRQTQWLDLYALPLPPLSNLHRVSLKSLLVSVFHPKRKCDSPLSLGSPNDVLDYL